MDVLDDGDAATVQWWLPLVRSDYSPFRLGRFPADEGALARVAPQIARQPAYGWTVALDEHLASGPLGHVSLTSIDEAFAILVVNRDVEPRSSHPLDILVREISLLRESLSWYSREAPADLGVDPAGPRCQAHGVFAEQLGRPEMSCKEDGWGIAALGACWQPMPTPIGEAGATEGFVLVLAENRAFDNPRTEDHHADVGGRLIQQFRDFDSARTLQVEGHRGGSSLATADLRHLALNIEHDLGFHGGLGLDASFWEVQPAFQRLAALRGRRTWELIRAATAIDEIPLSPDAASDLRELRRRRAARNFAGALSVVAHHSGVSSDGEALVHRVVEAVEESLRSADSALDQLDMAIEDASQSDSLRQMALLASATERAQNAARPIVIGVALLALAGLWVGISSIPGGKGAFWPSVPRALGLLMALAGLLAGAAWLLDRVARRWTGGEPRRRMAARTRIGVLLASVATFLGAATVVTDGSTVLLALSLACGVPAVILLAWGFDGAPTARSGGAAEVPALEPRPGTDLSHDRYATQVVHSALGIEEVELMPEPYRTRNLDFTRAAVAQVGLERLQNAATTEQWARIEPYVRECLASGGGCPAGPVQD